jgi:SagB-type dehydrogenase family enzyme
LPDIFSLFKNMMVMQKILFSILLAAFLCNGTLSSQVIETLPLAEPEKTGGMPLFDALSKRSSIRSFQSVMLTDKDLSNLLWAAFGVNREDGRRTAPSARNWQQFDIYLIMADGWYLFEPKDHALLKMGNEDLREYAGSQDYVKTAPLNLIYVSDHERMTGADMDNRIFHSATDVGFIAQNVYLYCASEGLATVVRGLVDRDGLHEVLKLRPSQHVILGQTVGYPGD